MQKRFPFSIYQFCISDPGDGDRDAEQAQAEVHGNAG